jgi:hypothetical protein
MSLSDLFLAVLMTTGVFIDCQSSTSQGHCELSAGYEGILSTVLSEIRQLRKQMDRSYSEHALDATHNAWVYQPSVKKYYRVIFELVDWDTANSRCIQQGTTSRLVVVNNKQEHNVIREFLSSVDGRLLQICRVPKYMYATSPLEGFWTSGQRADRTHCETVWVWKPDAETTLPLDMELFKGSAQPNCINGTEHCAQYLATRFHLNDLNCDWLACPLCEMAEL